MTEESWQADAGGAAQFNDEDAPADWDSAYDEKGQLAAAEPPASAPAPASENKSTTKSKTDTKKKRDDEPDEPVREKTREEVQRDIEESERNLAAELCAPSSAPAAPLVNGAGAGAIDSLEPVEKAQFDQLATAIATKCTHYRKSEHYKDFVESLCRQLVNEMELKNARTVRDALNEVISEKQKDAERQTKAKSKKGTKLTGGKLKDVKGTLRSQIDEVLDFVGGDSTPAGDDEDGI